MQIDRTELVNMLMKSWNAGFVEACRWSEPVTQDVDSLAAMNAMNEQILHIIRNRGNADES